MSETLKLKNKSKSNKSIKFDDTINNYAENSFLREFRIDKVFFIIIILIAY